MYPDVLVACRPLAPDDDRVADPTVVVEVLSPTTEATTASASGGNIRRSPRSAFRAGGAERAARRGLLAQRDGWELAVVEPPDDAVTLKAVGASLSLEAMYEEQRPLSVPSSAEMRRYEKNS